MKNLKKNEKREGQLNELALFAGAGGGILGGHLLGWRCVAAVEIEDYPRRVLLQRQADGILPRFPIWDDVQTFDGRLWRGKVDVISGGFPCQDISVAGKGAGIDGERSGMWSHMARIIGEVLPRFVFVENSPMLVGRGLTRVLSDLAEMGYDAKWGIVGAHHVSAPHKRDRIWIVAFSSGARARDLFRETGNEDRRASGEQLPTLRQGNRANGSDRIDSTSEGERKFPDSSSERCNLRSCAEREHEDNPDQHRQSQEGEQQRSKRVNGTGEACSDMAYTNSSGSDKNSSMCELRTGGVEQSSTDKRLSNKTQGREEPKRCNWWQNDPADIPNARNDRNEQRIGQLREGEQAASRGSDQRGDSQEHESGERRATEPELGRVAHGVADRVDRLKAIGNGQVSAVAELAWEILTKR